MPPALVDLAQRCYAYDSRERPTCAELVMELAAIETGIREAQRQARQGPQQPQQLPTAPVTSRARAMALSQQVSLPASPLQPAQPRSWHGHVQHTQHSQRAQSLGSPQRRPLRWREERLQEFQALSNMQVGEGSALPAAQVPEVHGVEHGHHMDVPSTG